MLMENIKKSGKPKEDAALKGNIAESKKEADLILLIMRLKNQ